MQVAVGRVFFAGLVAGCRWSARAMLRFRGVTLATDDRLRPDERHLRPGPDHGAVRRRRPPCQYTAPIWIFLAGIIFLGEKPERAASWR